MTEQQAIEHVVNEPVTVMPSPHFHVICCPHCFTEAVRAECVLDDCGFPDESKRSFPSADVYDCRGCGNRFYASFGMERVRTDAD